MNTTARKGYVIGLLLCVFSLVFFLFQGNLSASTEEQVTAKTTTTTSDGPREKQQVPPLCYDTPASRLQALTGEWVENAISLQDVPYYNLSCPLEWDRYSCVHQEKFHQAELAATTRFQPQGCRMASDRYTSEQLSNLLMGRKVFFAGDSLLRQILLSLGCLWYSRSVDYVDALQWRPCPSAKNATTCYESKVKNCVPCGRNSDSLPRTELRLGNTSPRSLFLHVWNKTLAEKLTNKDVLVVEAGVHDHPDVATNKLVDFLWGMLTKRNHVRSEMPKIVYVVTWPPTFPGVPGGLYNLSLLQRRKSSGQSMACVATTNDYFYLETKALKDKKQGDIHLMDYISGIVWLQGTGSQGMNKVGEGRFSVGDCQHFCLPGPPDDFARALETMLFQVMRNS